MKEFQALVTLAPWTFLFTICNLLILMTGIKHFLFKPVQEVLAKRAQEVEDTYEKAESARTDAEAMQTEYRQRLSDAKSEANEIVKAANATASAQAGQLMDEAQKEAAALKRRAEQDIEAERKKAALELKGDISQLALELAGKVVEKELDEADASLHQKLIDSFIGDVGDLT